MSINSLLLEADVTIVTGAVSFHYLAGFGRGRKCIIPGVAGYQTILDTHKRVFNRTGPGKHERAQTGILEGNPMHEAIMEGIALIDRPLFLINTIFDDTRTSSTFSRETSGSPMRKGAPGTTNISRPPWRKRLMWSS